MENFLADVNDSLDDLNEKVHDFGTDMEGILDFKEYFEELADKLMTVSATMQGAHTPEMDDSIKTLKAKFKQSYMHQDYLFADLLLDFGEMEMDEGLKARAQAFMKMTSDVDSMDETPTALQLCHLEFLMVKEKIDVWLDRLEELFPWTAFGENEELPNLQDMDKARRQERIKKMMPKLVKLNGGISTLLWACRGMNDVIVRLFQLGDMVKKILEPSKEAQNDIAAMIFAAANKVIPTIKRLLRADKNIEKFLKVCPSKVGSECAKLDKWLLDDIDTKMTVLGTELLIGVSFLVECFSSAEEEAVN